MHKLDCGVGLTNGLVGLAGVDHGDYVFVVVVFDQGLYYFVVALLLLLPEVASEE